MVIVVDFYTGKRYCCYLFIFIFFFSLHKVKCLDVLEVVGSEGKSAEFQVNVVGQLLSIVLLLKHPHLPSPWWVDGMG